jgi:hypothetical protein
MPVPVQHWRTMGAICLLLAVIHTWPLATGPGILCRNDNGDAQLNEWILAWVAHQLPRDPVRLFQANIFHPAPDALAFSEPLIAPALMGAPLRWLGASPVLVFNVVLILGFALTALAACWLVSDWTGSRGAALLAGSTFAFNTHTLTRLAHIQAMHAWGLPLALLATDRLLVTARVRDAFWLAFWMSALAYTSGYLAMFGVVLVVVALAARAPWWWREGSRVLTRFALASLVTVVAVLPVYLPYQRVANEQGLVRSIENVADYSASLGSYAASAGRLHYWLWSEEFFKSAGDAFFPGVIVMGLSLVAIVRAVRGSAGAPGDPDRDLTRQRVVMLVAVAAAGLVLSLGTRTPVYGWVFEVFPPIRGMRAASRFGNLFLLGMAGLSGLGLAALLRGRLGRRAGLAAALGVILANGEVLRAPFTYTRYEGIPHIYTHLATAEEPVVLVEVPFYPARAAFENATYVLNSTAHFRPLMNGYSGYVPASYRAFAVEFASFPEPAAIEAMRRGGATHVMVHPGRLRSGSERDAEVLEAIARNPALERVAIGRDGMTLYRLR